MLLFLLLNKLCKGFGILFLKLSCFLIGFSWFVEDLELILRQPQCPIVEATIWLGDTAQPFERLVVAVYFEFDPDEIVMPVVECFDYG